MRTLIRASIDNPCPKTIKDISNYMDKVPRAIPDKEEMSEEMYEALSDVARDFLDDRNMYINEMMHVNAFHMQ